MKSRRIYLSKNCSIRVCDQLPNLRHQVSLDIDVQIWTRCVEIFLEILHAKFISVLVLSVVLRMFLHSIVRQVYELVMHILNVKFLAARSDICVLIEIALEVPVDRCHHTVAAEIELSSMNQQGVVYVPLNDKCGLSIRRLKDQTSDFVQVAADTDAVTAICIFTWFYDPYVLMHWIL